MKKRHSGKLYIYSDTYLQNIFQQAFDRAVNSMIFLYSFSMGPKAGKRTSSRKKDTYTEDIAYQFRGYPTDIQAGAMSQTIGACRWTWNQMLSDRLDVLNATGHDTLRPTPAQYKTKDRPWLKECDSYALCNVQLNLEGAFSDWNDGKHGKPKYKKKHACPDSYTTNKDKRCNNIVLTRNGLVLPKVPGVIQIKCHRPIRKGGVLKSVTVTHEPDGQWIFSILIEYPKQRDCAQDQVLELLQAGKYTGLSHIGLDMSLTHLYVDSNGNFPFYTLTGKNGSTVTFTKQYSELQSKMAREQRHLSKMKKGSHNYEKQLIKIARLHARAKHARQDFLRQMAIRLARQYSIISIEDLDVQGMKQALRFGKSVSDISWGTFTQYLEAACNKTGSFLIYVSRWFPSSKTCSYCKYVKHDLKLNERTYICPNCGHVMDRDHQAAINIDREGFSIVTHWFRQNQKMLPRSKASIS